MVPLRTLIFTIFVPGTVAGVIPWLLLRGSGTSMALTPSIWMVGFLPLGLGVGLYLWCAGAFTFIGKGTPAPIDAPKVLVIQGPYRWVRNPMYIGVLAVIIGEAMVFRSMLLVGYALTFWVMVHTFVVFVEEPSLRSRFGAGYDAYLRAVPRWIPHTPRG